MRLLHFIHTPRHSGAEILVRDLCLCHIENGVDCAIAAFETGPPEFQVELENLRRAGVQIISPIESWGRFGRLASYFNAVREFRPDAAFGHSLIPAAYGRLALTIAGSHAPFFKVLHSGSDDYQSIRVRWVERMLQLRTDAIITVAPAAAESYRHHFKDTPPIVHVSNGVNLDLIRAQLAGRSKFKTTLGLRDQSRLLLQVGRISPVKNQRLTLAALAPLLASDPSVQLWFVGIDEDGAYCDALAADISALGLNDQIRALGPRTDIPALLAAADAYLMPSSYEAQGIAFLEAMASGVPIIASDIPAFAFARGRSGIALIDPLDQKAFLREVTAAIQNNTRYVHNLDAYDIRATAKAYEGLGFRHQ